VQNTQRFRVYEGVGPPPPNAGPPTKWGHLPFDTIQVGDLIEVTLESEEVSKRINAIRSYAGRLARKTGKKFSVRITDYGIGIWRTI
jgi:hypothetical protein